MKKLVIGITAPGSVILIAGQLQYFKALGYETYLMAPTHERVTDYCQREGCVHLPVDFEREISLFKDLKALVQVAKHLKRVKPDVVNFGTPKVSLLGMIGAKLVGVKRRIYTCRGFRFENEIGLKRSVLIIMEKVTGFFSSTIICISPSLKEYAVKEKIFNIKKTYVINKGSSNGIDLEQFSQNRIDLIKKNIFLHENNIEDKFIFGFVGRLVKDKGIFDLFEAFIKLYNLNKDISLMILGSDITSSNSDKKLVEAYKNHPGILFLGYQNDVPFYMSMFDVMVLPSHREGFGNVYIQAAALGVACIGCDITGVKDAVSHDFNGLLVQRQSQIELYNAMEKLYFKKELADQFGKNGLEWAKFFDSKKIWDVMDEHYRK